MAVPGSVLLQESDTPVSPEQWARVRELFDQLADLTAEERKGPLNSAHPEVREAVESLLATYDAPPAEGALLDTPVPANSPVMQWLLQAQNFYPGDLLENRFEVREMLGRGGMGEVYRCLDRQSNTEMAIKTLRFEFRRDEPLRARFIKEVQRAKQVSHRNVCRVHELFTSSDEDGTELPFFSMELLRGVTLRQHVRSHGPLSMDEATTLARGLCAGLQEAHRSRLIHRDLKSGNVMLVQERAGFLVKIMDFGLARELPSTGDTLLTGGASDAEGTLAYMAPESLEGKSATIASDIYSLGVVLYEAVTGRPPFQGQAEIVSAAMRFRHAPPNPTSLRPDLPARWAATLLACLDVNTAARPISASEVLEVLDGNREARWRMAVRRVRARTTRRHLLAALAFGTAAVASPGVRRQLIEPPFADRSARVLIANFNVTGADPVLGRAVRSLTRVALFSIPNLRPLAPGEASGAIQALELGTAPLRGSVALRVAEHAKADLVIDGDIDVRGDSYSIHIKATRPGAFIAAADYTVVHKGPLAGLHRPLADLKERLTEALVGNTLAAGVPGVQEVLRNLSSDNPAAIDEFAAGLEYFLSGEVRSALPRLERARDLDPKFALAFIYESKVAGAQRNDKRAFEAITKAYALRDGLTRRLQLETEAIHRLLTADPHGSLEAQRQLVTEYPAESHLHRQVAQTYCMLDQPEEAVRHGRAAVELDPSAGNNYMILAASLGQTGKVGDAVKVLAAGRRASASNPELLLLSEARMAGMQNDGQRSLDLLRELERKPGWQLMARELVARLSIWTGQLSEARQHLEASIGLAQTAGELGRLRQFQSMLGSVNWLFGDLATTRSIARTLADAEPLPYLCSTLRSAALLAWASKDGPALDDAASKLRLIEDSHPSSQTAGCAAQADSFQLWIAGDREAAVRRASEAHGLFSDLQATWSFAALCRRTGDYDRALALYESMRARRNAACRFDTQAEWVMGLAEAGICERSRGRHAAAHGLFETFLSHWGRQADLPLVQEVLRLKSGLGGNDA
ncbi:MAG TPA: protein kinase [Bryobacteraceae bacterium]|nr:protein kinase [Bryobacteraceae bacterium]